MPGACRWPTAQLVAAVDSCDSDATQLAVLRRLVLVALLCWSAWAAADRVAAFSAEGPWTSAGTACQLTEAPGNTDGSDRQWGAGQRTSASVTESVWRSQVHHSELATAPCFGWFDVLVRSAEPARRPRDAALRLHSIPLLI
jgi:hypothetical protein